MTSFLAITMTTTAPMTVDAAVASTREELPLADSPAIFAGFTLGSAPGETDGT